MWEGENERTQERTLEFWPEQQGGRDCHPLRGLSVEQNLGRALVPLWKC